MPIAQGAYRIRPGKRAGGVELGQFHGERGRRQAEHGRDIGRRALLKAEGLTWVANLDAQQPVMRQHQVPREIGRASCRERVLCVV